MRHSRVHIVVNYCAVARVKHYEACKVKYLFKRSRRHIKQKSHFARCSSEIPDMRYRSRKLYVSHTFTANLCTCYFNAASVAHNAFKAHFLEFAAVTLPVLSGSEYFFAVQAVLFRLQCPVIYGFRLFYLSVRPFSNFFWGSKSHTDGNKII